MDFLLAGHFSVVLMPFGGKFPTFVRDILKKGICGGTQTKPILKTFVV